MLRERAAFSVRGDDELAGVVAAQQGFDLTAGALTAEQQRRLGGTGPGALLGSGARRRRLTAVPGTHRPLRVQADVRHLVLGECIRRSVVGARTAGRGRRVIRTSAGPGPG